MQSKGKMSSTERISRAASGFSRNPYQERHRERPLISSIAKMTDDEIVQASIKNANQSALNSKAARALNKGPLMFIAATSMVYGALTKGKLSDKLAFGAATAVVGGVIAGLHKTVHNTVDTIMNKPKKDGSEKQTNPLIQAGVELVALMGASYLAIKGGQKGISALSRKFAPTAIDVANKVTKAAATVDNSFLGKATAKVSDKFNKFATKHPTRAKALTDAVSWAPFVGFVAGHSILTNKLMKDRNQNVLNNVAKLVAIRECAADVNNALDETV